MATTRTRRTPKRAAGREAFLSNLAELGNVRDACRAAGIGRSTAYEWRQDITFAGAWDAALEEAADALEGEARRRAVEGVEEPIYHRGEVVGHVQRYSDTLLIFLLKGLRPERFNVEGFVRLAEHKILTVELAELRQLISGGKGATE